MGHHELTPRADETLRVARQVPLEFLLRHKNGDWGELPEEDIRENEWSPKNGSRLFSAYKTRTDEKLWVITEWDRSVEIVRRQRSSPSGSTVTAAHGISSPEIDFSSSACCS
jgi:hypothetical protein